MFGKHIYIFGKTPDFFENSRENVNKHTIFVNIFPKSEWNTNIFAKRNFVQFSLFAKENAKHYFRFDSGPGGGGGFPR